MYNGIFLCNSRFDLFKIVAMSLNVNSFGLDFVTESFFNSLLLEVQLFLANSEFP